MEQEYIITVFSENKVGLLSQITTVFTCRDVNIESLTTSESALQGIHKFTIVVRTTPDQVDKLVRQVEKKIDVLKTFVYTPDEVVQPGRRTTRQGTQRPHSGDRRGLHRRREDRPQGRHAGVVPPAATLRRTAVRAQRHGGHHQVAARAAERVP